MERKDWSAPGLDVTYTLSHFSERTTHRGRGRDDTVMLHFGLRGDYSVRYPQLRKSFDLIGGHHNVLYARRLEIEFINKTDLVETFGIRFAKAAFEDYVAGTDDMIDRFCARVRAGAPSLLFPRWGAMTPALEVAIRELVTGSYQGRMQQLFVRSSCLEILMLALDAALDGRPRRYARATRVRERLVAARDLINQRLADPPTLPELAKLVGTNEYTLKRGFKEMFGTTVFSYLTTQRLALARTYLLETDKTAAEIANELGYATPQHFHAAFKKHFQRTPNSMRKAP